MAHDIAYSIGRQKLMTSFTAVLLKCTVDGHAVSARRQHERATRATIASEGDPLGRARCVAGGHRAAGGPQPSLAEQMAAPVRTLGQRRPAQSVAATPSPTATVPGVGRPPGGAVATSRRAAPPLPYPRPPH